jgi:hypothetical protein
MNANVIGIRCERTGIRRRERRTAMNIKRAGLAKSGAA